MPEPLSHPSSDDRVNPADGLSPSVSDPNVTTGSESTAAPSTVPSLPSQRYSLLAEIACGGMGVIWRATDSALGREVAVKVLHDKFAPDSAAARRFAAEARITAQLQHPAIPPVHDFGNLPDGRPFLAMKLIKGRTLQELLRQRSDPAADRGRFLAVFEQVCQALAYAHAHQVIHRDLKPGNVMVGGFGEVQVMDWGLAKVLTETAAPVPPTGEQVETVAGTLIRGSDSLYTQAGSVLGTLAYMPPEQAAGEIGKVDQRSDVFGLGAMLAVILTGRPPYFGPDNDAVRVMAIRGDLAACLERLDGCGAEAELVTLCKRCLAFAPADRPGNAGVVAEEIAGVRAAAEERARAAERERAAAEARAAEQRRKRRWQLAAAGMVVLALLAGLGGLAAFLRAQKQANADLQAANQREHERFELALEAIKTFHTGVSEDALLKEEEFKSLRERLLGEAARFYGKLQRMLEGQPDAASQRALAESYFLLAELTTLIGSYDDALALHRRALELRRQRAARGELGAELEVARSLLGVADCLGVRSEYAEARTAADEARHLAEAADPSDEALAVVADSYESLGVVSFNLREWKEYHHQVEQALVIRQKLADANSRDASLREKLVQTYGFVGVALGYLGRNKESLQAYETAIEIAEKEARSNPGNASLQDNLARVHYMRGEAMHQQTGKLKEALSEYATAIEIEQKAIDANPAVSRYKDWQAAFILCRGHVLAQLGKSKEALQAYQEATKIQQHLADSRPAFILFQVGLADSRTAIGHALIALGRPSEALAEFDKAVLIYRKLTDTQRKRYHSSIAYHVRNRGIALQKLSRQGEAVAAYRESVTMLEGLARPLPANLYALACSYALLHGIAGEKGSGLTAADAHDAGEHALATLRRAIAAGYHDLANLRKDTDLDSLRTRPDFQKLLAEVEKDTKVSGK
jgi:tetratricopeptide (TPR) repeat protein